VVGVSIVNLHKRFGKTEAVREFTLEIRDGEFFVLLGPSGSGKSTVLNCIAGILRPDKGEIWIGDKLVASAEKKIYIPPQERNLGMVFQDYALYPHMTVFDNIAFPLKVRGESPETIKDRVTNISAILGIQHLLSKKPAQLSGGERQRVALARALIRNPPLLLMDEPLSNLDAKLRVLMRVELKKIQREFRSTVVYVTHDQVEAMSMGDRVGVMSSGVLQQVATPEEIYEKPLNTFIAGFIGSPPMNMFNCRMQDFETGTVLCEFGEYKLPEAYGRIAAEKKVLEIVLGVRPEHVKVSVFKEEGSFPGKVMYTEKLGRELVAHLKIADTRLTAIIPPEQAEVASREEVWISFRVDKLHVFEKQSGKNLLNL